MFQLMRDNGTPYTPEELEKINPVLVDALNKRLSTNKIKKLVAECLNENLDGTKKENKNE